MKTLIIALLMLGPAQRDSSNLSVLFWNLENFFDYFDGGTGDSDAEFSSMGARRWTKKRFTAKCMSVSKAVFAISDRYGKIPDIIAVAEVENASVLRKLVALTPLRRYGYKVVHYDSDDPRGIDVGLLYRPDMLRLECSRPCGIPGLRTRDILFAGFVSCRDDSIAVLVNHHPSKYGGEASGLRRKAAVSRMDQVADSLRSEGWGRCISIGDFNDVPESDIYRPLSRSWKNLSDSLSRKGVGSIRFEGRWQLIDQCLVSHELAPDAVMEVCQLPFLLTRDAAHSGQKPFRTYSGPRYIGGVSDHLPIVVIIHGFL